MGFKSDTGYGFLLFLIPFRSGKDYVDVLNQQNNQFIKVRVKSTIFFILFKVFLYRKRVQNQCNSHALHVNVRY